MPAYVKGFMRMTEQEQYQHLVDVHAEEIDEGTSWELLHTASHNLDEQDHQHTI